MGAKHALKIAFLALRMPTRPSRDAADRRIEIIQTDEHAVFIVIPDNLIHDALEFVIQRDDMIAVPTHAAADMQQNLLHKLEHGGDLRADDLGGVKMSGIQRIEHAAADGITKRIFMASDRVTLDAKTEEAWLSTDASTFFLS